MGVAYVICGIVSSALEEMNMFCSFTAWRKRLLRVVCFAFVALATLRIIVSANAPTELPHLWVGQLQVKDDGGAALVTWETGTEADVLGLNLYRGTRPTRDGIVRVNEELWLAQRMGKVSVR